MAKGQEYLLAHGDEITIGSGVPKDMSQFIVIFPGKSANQPPTEGVHAYYDMRSEVLGQGAFAVVKKAIQRSTGNWYAIKVIDKKKVMTGVAVEREIDILKKIKHDYIVGLTDFYEDENNYYLVMDLVTGGDLMDFVTQNGAIPEDAAREITRQVLTAVEYVHSCGISHRDIKPDNILIAQDEPVIVKVSDFGLAKISKSGSQLRTFCGTLAYLAPEIMAKKHSDGNAPSMYSNKVDVWSIGCMLYVILTSYLPFSNRTQQELYRSVMSGHFAERPLLDVGASKDCIGFLHYALTVDPAKRPSATQALHHPWFDEIFEDQAEASAATVGGEATADGAAPSVSMRSSAQSGAVRKSMRCPSIKPQRSIVHKDPSSLGIKNPDDFVSPVRKHSSQEDDSAGPSNLGIDGADDVPDIDHVPELSTSKSSYNSGKDMEMETPEKKKPVENGIGKENVESKSEPQVTSEQHQENGKTRDSLPTTQKIKQDKMSQNSQKPPAKDSAEVLAEKHDSDKDDENIAKASEDQIRERYERANSSAFRSSLHKSSPSRTVEPLVSVVRDMDHNEGTDVPLATWMVLTTLDNSIPHSNICLTQPCITFGRFSEDGLDVVLDDNRISKMHAVIWLELIDQSQDSANERYKVWAGDWSRNGCYINGKFLGRGRKARLQEGDTIYFLKELRKVELLGFKVKFTNPSAVIPRTETDPTSEPFDADSKTFKQTYMGKLKEVQPGLQSKAGAGKRQLEFGNGGDAGPPTKRQSVRVEK